MSDQLEFFGGESFEPRKPCQPPKRPQPRKASRQKSLPFNLFLAIQPDDPAAMQGRGIGSTFLKEHLVSGTMQPFSKLHVSLLGFESETLPGENVISAIKQVAQAIVPHKSRFEITFDRLSSFGHGEGDRPLVLTNDKVANADLRCLYDATFEEVCVIFGPLQKQGFTPHMTLLYMKHQVGHEPAGPVSWMAREVVLILSERGTGEYQVLGRWSLGA
ncbi:MAG: 2'-5' RNA ligase family protein [Roseimicrobium sp.]